MSGALALAPIHVAALNRATQVASCDQAERHATRRRLFFVDAQFVRPFVPAHDLPPFRRQAPLSRQYRWCDQRQPVLSSCNRSNVLAVTAPPRGLSEGAAARRPRGSAGENRAGTVGVGVLGEV